jgi:hypothetical protein
MTRKFSPCLPSPTPMMQLKLFPMSFLLADCPLSLYYSWHPFCLHLLVVVVLEMHYTKFLKNERRCATIVKQQSLCPALHPRACLFFQTTLASSQTNKGGPHYRGGCSGCHLATAISLPLHWPCDGDHAGCCCPFFENWDFLSVGKTWTRNIKSVVSRSSNTHTSPSERSSARENSLHPHVKPM